MNNEYSFNSKVVEDAIVNLKSSFFDIYSHQTTALANLQSGTDRLSPANRAKVEALILAQSEKLTRSMMLINEVVKNAELVDANGLKAERLINSSVKNSAKAAQLVKAEEPKKKVVDEKIEPVTEASTEATTEVVTEAVQAPVVEEKTEPATEASTEATTEASVETNANPVIIPVVNVGDGTSIFDASPTEPVRKKEYIADTPEQANLDMFNMFKALPGMEKLKMNADGKPDFSAILPKDIASKIAASGDTSLSGIISTIAKESKAQSGVVEPVLPVIPVEGESQDNNGVVSDVNEASTEIVAMEESTEAVQQNSDVSEQIIIPTIAPPSAPTNSVVAANDITNEIGDALNNLEISTEVTTEAVQEIIPVVVDNANAQDGVISTDAGAEAVTESVEQVVVDETGYRRFVDSGGQAKAILVSEVQYNKLISSNVTQEALLKFKHVFPDTSAPVKATTDDTANMSDDEKRKTIESMMADATALYNAGKVQEAQVMYDKISELNKTLVKS